jgi:LmbE family N-acetylglucosaminyl deacetylase
MDNIMFLVAHPDDLACTMGGTALLLKDRYRLHVFCTTKGERGLPGKKGMAATARLREREEAAACAMLGAKLTFLGRIDREVFADKRICREVAAHLARLKPVALFTLWAIDSHPDHSAVSEIARKAVFLTSSPTELLYTEANVRHQTSQFQPDLHVDIASVIDGKAAMIRCHQCQNSGDRLIQMAMLQSSFRGAEISAAHAEVFKTVRPATVQRPSLLYDLLKA